MNYNLKNPVLVEGSLEHCSVDLKLPRDLLHQTKLEMKRAAITLKDVYLAPVKPSNHAMKINASFSCNIFIVLNCVYEDFTPSSLVSRINSEFKKVFPDHKLATLKNDAIKLHLMPGQKVFTPNKEILNWLLPDFAANILTQNEVNI